MLKIGDFSKFCRVSVKTLRYYDEIGLLKPVSIDESTGYRYYSADQITILNRIIALKELGLSLEEINWILAGNLSTDKVIELLRAKHKETLARLREEEARLNRVEAWLKKMEKEGTMPENEVVLKNSEAQTVASVRGIIPTYGDISILFKDLYSYLGRKRIKISGPPMAVYHDAEYREKDPDVEVVQVVTGNGAGNDKIKVYQLPAVEQMACIIHKGPYENLGQTYQALMTWVEAHGYQTAGSNREVYIKGPGQILKGNPANYITEVQLPVKKG
jgi:effector-binding domain-containing protein